MLLAGDESLIRQGIAHIIRNSPDMEVTNSSDEGLRTTSAPIAENADVVVFDADRLELTGSGRADNPLQAYSGCPVLVISSDDRDPMLFRSLEAGATGFALKAIDADEFLEAVRIVSRGDVYISPSMATKLVGDYLRRVRGSRDEDDYDRLSARERQVLTLLAEGMSHHDIADVLGVSPYTVQTFRQRIMKKLDLHNGTQILRYALRKRLVSLEE